MSKKNNPVTMSNADLLTTMHDLLEQQFESFEDREAFAGDYGVDLLPRDQADVTYERADMIKLVSELQKAAEAEHPGGEGDDQDEASDAGAGNGNGQPPQNLAAPKKSAYYRSRPRKLGIRSTVQGARTNGAGLVEMVPLCGPVHLVFGTNPYGVCEITEGFAQAHRKPSGEAYTFEEMVALIEGSAEFQSGDFRRIPESEVFKLPNRSEPVKLTRGAVGSGRK